MAAGSLQGHDGPCSAGVTAEAAGMSLVRGVGAPARLGAPGGELTRRHNQTHTHGTDSNRAWPRGLYKVMTGPVVQA
jgi:hypothetical protein